MGIPAQILGVLASGLPLTLAGSEKPLDQANAVVSDTFAAVGPGKPFIFRGPANVVIYASYNTALTTTAGSANASVAAIGAIVAGSSVNSPNVPPGTTVKSLSGGNNIVLAFPKLTLYGVVNTVQAQISGLVSTTGLLGATVTGPGIPSGTTVIAIPVPAIAGNANVPPTPGTVELSALPTASPLLNYPSQPFEFAPTGNVISVTGADATATFTGAAIVYTGTVQIERSFDGGGEYVPLNIGGGGTLASYSAGTPVSLSFGESEKGVMLRLNCLAYSAIAGTTLKWRASATGEAATALSIPAVIGS